MDRIRTHPIRSRLIIALGLSLVLAVLSLFVFDYGGDSEGRRASQNPSVQGTTGDWLAALEDLMQAQFFGRNWARGLEKLSESGSDGFSQFEVTMRYPRRYQIHDFIFRLSRVSEAMGGKIMESHESLKPRQLQLGVLIPDNNFIQLRFREDPALEWTEGRIAVIIDDFGYRNADLARSFFDLPFSITVAIIPGTEHAEEIARKAQQSGHEILIHLPMEPMEGAVERAGYTISTGMSLDQIEAVVDRALAALPGAVGINNHMGSKATSDRQLMTQLMACLKKKGLFFVDSFTSRNSIAYDVAQKAEIPALRLTSFLDNPANKKSLAEIMDETYAGLLQEPEAVLIGHDRLETGAALLGEMTRLAGKGVSYVHASDLLEYP